MIDIEEYRTEWCSFYNSETGVCTIDNQPCTDKDAQECAENDSEYLDEIERGSNFHEMLHDLD